MTIQGKHVSQRSVEDNDAERRQMLWFGFVAVTFLASVSIGYYVANGSWIALSGMLFFVLHSGILASRLIKELRRG